MRRAAAAALFAALLALAGCADKPAPAPQPPDGAAEPEEALERTHLIAVLPIEPAPPPPQKGASGGPAPAADAGVSVTAQVYRMLAEQTDFRVVPDLTVEDEMTTPEVRAATDLLGRAVALGKQVGADAVIFGRVFRFQKRVGTDYGVTQPASVWFELAVVDVASGDTIWRDEFDQTQQPLSSNLLNWWMFWRSGPRWMSAGELAGVGVERMFGHITAAIQQHGA